MIKTDGVINYGIFSAGKRFFLPSKIRNGLAEMDGVMLPDPLKNATDFDIAISDMYEKEQKNIKEDIEAQIGTLKMEKATERNYPEFLRIYRAMHKAVSEVTHTALPLEPAFVIDSPIPFAGSIKDHAFVITKGAIALGNAKSGCITAHEIAHDTQPLDKFYIDINAITPEEYMLSLLEQPAFRAKYLGLTHEEKLQVAVRAIKILETEPGEKDADNIAAQACGGKNNMADALRSVIAWADKKIKPGDEIKGDLIDSQLIMRINELQSCEGEYPCQPVAAPLGRAPVPPHRK